MIEPINPLPLGKYLGGRREPLLLFLEEIYREFKARRGGSQLLEELGTIEELGDRLVEMGDSSVIGLVTCDDKKITGLISARLVANSFESCICIVTVFAVLKDVRRQGLGTVLFNSIMEWCKGMGAIAVDVTALPGDRHTKNFFEANGLTARSLTMHKSL